MIEPCRVFVLARQSRSETVSTCRQMPWRHDVGSVPSSIVPLLLHMLESSAGNYADRVSISRPGLICNRTKGHVCLARGSAQRQ